MGGAKFKTFNDFPLREITVLTKQVQKVMLLSIMKLLMPRYLEFPNFLVMGPHRKVMLLIESGSMKYNVLSMTLRLKKPQSFRALEDLLGVQLKLCSFLLVKKLLSLKFLTN